MKRPEPADIDALSLVERIDPQYSPVWEGRSPEERAALAMYFLPHRSGKPLLAPSRPRVIKWYCPFACQSSFPSGHRYCINVFTGCAHNCLYCYALGYAPDVPSCKKDFQKMILRDIEDLERFNVPPAPVHLSNSTDPFQPLEAGNGHTKYTLTQVLAHRSRFTSVTILTKNPLMPVRLGYIDLFEKLVELPPDHPRASDFRQRGFPGFCVEVSLAFWREEARAEYDPGAPTVEERKEGLRALRRAGIPLVLRIDPLFPRSPLGANPTRSYASFGLVEPQTAEDIVNLVGFAKELGVRHVVYSPAKIVQPRGKKLSSAMQAMRRVYDCVAAPDSPVFHGGAWRLPDAAARTHVTQPFLETCGRLGVAAKYCKHNLIETP
jgi:DNA repair photolyase